MNILSYLEKWLDFFKSYLKIPFIRKIPFKIAKPTNIISINHWNTLMIFKTTRLADITPRYLHGTHTTEERNFWIKPHKMTRSPIFWNFLAPGPIELEELREWGIFIALWCHHGVCTRQKQQHCVSNTTQRRPYCILIKARKGRIKKT